jgi:hypothetical protein
MRPLGFKFSVGGLYTFDSMAHWTGFGTTCELTGFSRLAYRAFFPSTQLQGHFWDTFLSFQSIISSSYKVITE